jgi:hypothetical protein
MTVGVQQYDYRAVGEEALTVPEPHLTKPPAALRSASRIRSALGLCRTTTLTDLPIIQATSTNKMYLKCFTGDVSSISARNELRVGDRVSFYPAERSPISSSLR